jgi:hypothetical protein
LKIEFATRTLSEFGSRAAVFSFRFQLKAGQLHSLTLHAATDYEGKIHANSGIALIVPVEQLKALLNSPELQNEKDNAFNEYKKKH